MMQKVAQVKANPNFVRVRNGVLYAGAGALAWAAPITLMFSVS